MGSIEVIKRYRVLWLMFWFWQILNCVCSCFRQRSKSEEKAVFLGVNSFHHKTTQRLSRRWICHFCERFGHIRPFCYKLHGYSNRRYYGNINKKNFDRTNSKTEQRVKRKKNLDKFNVAFTSVHASSSEDQYFDGGCSRHTTENSAFVSEFKKCSAGHRTFGDGVKDEVIGKGNIRKPGLPILKYVRLVKGLSTNQISISKLCDQGFNVNFLTGICLVADSDKTLVITGTQSYKNCYVWTPNVLNLVAASLSTMSLCHLLKIKKISYSN